MNEPLEALLLRAGNLALHLPRVQQELDKAAKTASVSPDWAVASLRRILEVMMREVFEQKIKEPAGTRPLENIITRIVKDGHLPKKLNPYVGFIRELGNVGVHSFEDVTIQDFRRGLEQLLPILEWYAEWSSIQGENREVTVDGKSTAVGYVLTQDDFALDESAKQAKESSQAQEKPRTDCPVLGKQPGSLGLRSALFCRMNEMWKRPGRRGMLMGLGCALIAWMLAHWPMFQAFEDWLQDGGFHFRSQQERSDIVLISLDEEALEKPLLHSSPEIAEVVRFLSDRGASAIGLDVMLSQKFRAVKELQKNAEGDATRLGDVIRATDKVVVATKRSRTEEGKWDLPLPQWVGEHVPGKGARLGFVGFSDDRNIIRRQRMIEDRGEKVHFALTLCARARKQKVDWQENGSLRLLPSGATVPLDADNKLRINFAGRAGTFKTIPFASVRTAAQKKEEPDFDGVIFIISARAQGASYATPFANPFWSAVDEDSAGLMSGPEIHANVIATLLDQAYIGSPSWPASLGIVLIAGAALGWCFSQMNLVMGFVLAIGYCFTWRLLCSLALAFFNRRIDIVPMLMLSVFVYGFTFLHRWWTLRRMLGIVQSEALVRLLENDPEAFDRRGEERPGTVLFANLHQFSRYCDHHSAAEVVTLLNSFFTTVVTILEKHGGAIYQYRGDSIIALFGLPAYLPDHALQGVRAAVEMAESVSAMRQRWAELGYPELEMGIGIHTGSLLTGMIGCRRRLDFAVIGQPVVHAIRIERRTKEARANILISADTFRNLPVNERRKLGCAEQPRMMKITDDLSPIALHAVGAEPLPGVRTAAPSAPTHA